MKRNVAYKSRKRLAKRRNRELLLTTSLFLLNSETLRKQFWNVKSAHYDTVRQQVHVGINTTKGKLGTTLSKLRKVSRQLSDHLYDSGITFRKAKIVFFVHREDENIERIYQLLDKVES